MNKHPRIEYVAGDDWEISATLLDETGTPYNLNLGNPVIMWRLLNVYGSAVIGDEAAITITDAINGIVSVWVPASVTSPLTSGLYVDALRLHLTNETGTLLMGLIEVIGDPWLSPEVTPMLFNSSPQSLSKPVTWKVNRLMS